MELILLWYVGSALLIALMSVIDLYHPVLREREMPVDTRILFYITFFIIATLQAPRLLYPCLSPLKGIEFRDALDKALFE